MIETAKGKNEELENERRFLHHAAAWVFSTLLWATTSSFWKDIFFGILDYHPEPNPKVDFFHTAFLTICFAIVTWLVSVVVGTLGARFSIWLVELLKSKRGKRVQIIYFGIIFFFWILISYIIVIRY